MRKLGTHSRRLCAHGKQSLTWEGPEHVSLPACGRRPLPCSPAAMSPGSPAPSSTRPRAPRIIPDRGGHTPARDQEVRSVQNSSRKSSRFPDVGTGTNYLACSVG